MKTLRCRIGDHGRRCPRWGWVRNWAHYPAPSYRVACGCGCHVPVVDVPANGYGRGRHVLEGVRV